MTFKCPQCKTIFKRDMRKKVERMFMTNKGYKSTCKETNKTCYCKTYVI